MINDRDSAKLHVEIQKMGSLVTQAIEDGVTAFKNYDLDLAKKIATGDGVIDAAEKDIESIVLSLLKTDLAPDDVRKVSTVFKINTDMERIGDQSADIAEILLYYKNGPMKSDLSNLFTMAEEVVYMVNGSIQAFINADLGTASRIIASDDKVDSLFADIRNSTIDLLVKDRGLADEAVDIIMIAKYLERIADHATNIAEWAIFAETGKMPK